MGPLAPRKRICPSAGSWTRICAHFTGGMDDPHPIPCAVCPSAPTRPGSTHTSLAGSARPSTTRTFRELLLAMAPSPKLSGQEGAQVPRLDRGREGGRLHITYCEPGALSRSPSAACPRRG